MKRTFMIDDLFWSSFNSINRPICNRVKNTGKRFFVSEEEFLKIYNMWDADKDLYWDHFRFVVLPFESIYIELETSGVSSIGSVGAAIENGKMCFIFGNSINHPGAKPAACDFECSFNDGQPIIFPNVKNQPDEVTKTNIRFASTYSSLLMFIFLLMSRTSGITTTNVPHTRGLHKGKLRAWRAHSELTINLSKINRKLVFNTGTRSGTIREHEVRATLAHYPESQKRNGCIHDYVRMETKTSEGGRRWRCEHCKGLRVEKKSFVRGNGKLGTKFHTYNVKM